MQLLGKKFKITVGKESDRVAQQRESDRRKQNTSGMKDPIFYKPSRTSKLPTQLKL